ncbi:MAG: NAD(P)-binding domain-containing protein [Solirubrobacteraceae bacterium]
MEITIIGTGNMARNIAARALAGGHSVTLLGHEAGKAEALAGALSQDHAGAKVVKAFNTTFAGTLATGAVAGQPLDGQQSSLSRRASAGLI